MAKGLLGLIAGKKGLQKYFEYVYSKAIDGMNYRNSGDFKSSGEIAAAAYVRSKVNRKGEGNIIFDVGANLGNYAMELVTVFSKENDTIYSFEPSKETYKALLKTIDGNPRIIPCNFGIGDAATTLELYTDNDTSGLASVYQRKLGHYNIDMSKHETINIDTIDNFCAKNNIQRIDFLKLDIEGNELNALLGAQQMLKGKKIQFIQFEFGGCNIDSRTFFQDFWYLLKDDYQFYRILKNGLQPINGYNESQEVFLTINFLLELKN
jgi:FkbM family methyltransferase